MAASTIVSIPLTAKDWELLIGITFNNPDPEIIDVFQQLGVFYKGPNKPAQNDTINISSTESVVIKLSQFLYGNTVMNVTKDTGASPLVRIMTALRQLNNIADNYITTTLTANDAVYANTLQQIKKNGREYIMNKQYDNQ